MSENGPIPLIRVKSFTHTGEVLPDREGGTKGVRIGYIKGAKKGLRKGKAGACIGGAV
jgi:hypothetical protein